MKIEIPEFDESASQEVLAWLGQVRDGLAAEEKLLGLAGSSEVVQAWLREQGVLPTEDLDPLDDRVALWLAHREERAKRFRDVHTFWGWVRGETRRGWDAKRKRDKRAAGDRREHGVRQADPAEHDSGRHDSRKLLLGSEMAHWESFMVGPEGDTRFDAFRLLCDTLFRVRLWRILAHPDPKKNHFNDRLLARLVFGWRQSKKQLDTSTKNVNNWLRPYTETLKRARDRRLIDDALEGAEDDEGHDEDDLDRQ